MNEELRKAIGQVEDLLSDMCIPTPDHLDAIKKLKDLAQAYLSCGELEEEEKLVCSYCGGNLEEREFLIILEIKK